MGACLLTYNNSSYLIILTINLMPTYSKMQQVIWDEFEEDVSVPTIWRMLKSRDWNRKQCKKQAQEQSQLARNGWKVKLAGWHARQLLFLDESSSNTKTGDQKYGWVPIGKKPTLDRLLHRRERYSILYLHWLHELGRSKEG